MARQTSTEESQSLSRSPHPHLTCGAREELDEAPRRARRKGTSEAPKKSFYDSSCFEVTILSFYRDRTIAFQDDISESMKEMSTRARRTRKSAQEEAAARLERQTSKDDVSKKVSYEKDGTLKRRNTGKKMDADKVKTMVSREVKDKKGSDSRKPVRSNPDG
jgi:hypothetical protein